MSSGPVAAVVRTSLVAALVFLVCCSPKPGPVAVVAVDGLEWDVVLPLVREGRLPTIEGLMRRGSFGTLSTRAPARSPVIWTTVVTGKEPADHGMQAKQVELDYDSEEGGPPERDSGEHGSGPPGVIVGAGPAVRSVAPAHPIGQLTAADLPSLGDVADITPTIVALRGVPIGRDMTGTILEDILQPGVLEGLAPTFIASHDTPEWLASRGRGDVARPGEEERLEQLRALGYLDEDGESVE